MKRYLVVADDFTGANDTGVQLRRRGYPTEVLLTAGMIPENESIVIDTESRTISSSEAYERVADLVQGISFDSFAYVIKKIDSTIRGNISQEIKALDEAYQPELIIFAPALPALGRTTVDGVQCLNGIEICKTELSKDPKNPVTEDNLVKLLGQVYEEDIILKKLDDVRREEISFTENRIYVCDAQTNEDLKSIILAANETGKKVMFIGTAGIADCIMEIENPAKPALGIVASVSTVTNKQMKFCEKCGCTLVKLPVHDLISGKASVEQYKQSVLEALNKGEDTILLANTSYDRSELQLSIDAGKKRGMTILQVGDYVQDVLGKLADQIIGEAAISGVFVTGGDTALGMLRNIEANGAEILSELLVGIPMVRVKGGRFDGLKLVTKAGAFGGEDAIAFAFRKIKEK